MTGGASSCPAGAGFGFRWKSCNLNCASQLPLLVSLQRTLRPHSVTCNFDATRAPQSHDVAATTTTTTTTKLILRWLRAASPTGRRSGHSTTSIGQWLVRERAPVARFIVRGGGGGQLGSLRGNCWQPGGRTWPRDAAPTGRRATRQKGIVTVAVAGATVARRTERAEIASAG